MYRDPPLHHYLLRASFHPFLYQQGRHRGIHQYPPRQDPHLHPGTLSHPHRAHFLIPWCKSQRRSLRSQYFRDPRAITHLFPLIYRTHLLQENPRQVRFRFRNHLRETRFHFPHPLKSMFPLTRDPHRHPQYSEELRHSLECYRVHLLKGQLSHRLIYCQMVTSLCLLHDHSLTPSLENVFPIIIVYIEK